MNIPQIKIKLDPSKKHSKSMTMSVFDFDDTLIVSEKHVVIVTRADGTKVEKDGKGWNLFVPQEGDEYDYSAFEKLESPVKNEPLWSIFVESCKKSWETQDSQTPHCTIILSARKKKEPLEKFFYETEKVFPNQINCLNIKPGVCNGLEKASWIKEAIDICLECGSEITTVHFYDDRDDCVREVANLSHTLQGVYIFSNQVLGSTIKEIKPLPISSF